MGTYERIRRWLRLRRRPTTQPNTGPNRLFALIAELREHIFTLAVAEPEPIDLLLEWWQTITPLPSLALTCRQAYIEATAIYYRQNTFAFNLEFDNFSRWLNCKTRTPGHRNVSVANLTKVKLHFIWLRERQPKHLLPSSGTFVVELRPDGKVGVTGYVDNTCSCHLRIMLEGCDCTKLGGGEGLPNRLIAYILRLEAFWRESEAAGLLPGTEMGAGCDSTMATWTY